MSVDIKKFKYDEKLLEKICQDDRPYLYYLAKRKSKKFNLTKKFKRAVFLSCKYRFHGFSPATANALAVGEVYQKFDTDLHFYWRIRVNILVNVVLSEYEFEIIE